MISTSIKNEQINIIGVEYPVWELPPIENAHQGEDGQYIGIREGLLRKALKDKVSIMLIKVKNPQKEIEITPQDFMKQSKIITRKSKFLGGKNYLMYMLKV